jgi:hypothetical protein
LPNDTRKHPEKKNPIFSRNSVPTQGITPNTPSVNLMPSNLEGDLLDPRSNQVLNPSTIFLTLKAA